MSKSDLNRRSRIDINDTKTVIFEKCAKALSDFESAITYEPQRRPAISNLITIYSALTGKTPEQIVADCAGKDTKHFKHALSCELDLHFAPIRDRFNALIADESTLKDILFDGAQKARKTAAKNVEELKEIIGFKL
ncbi:unnamed protein product [Anisakis simplex]|uniref:Tryptophan--tRNA ligase, mitochondrial (inferred by orthology to a C. elegans protein) n=1 Tax=Anisakis simplex TaxID=6269 RepID=A0A0M3KAJ0_ANISI|nr:unnamed protein product [Anisakis simplex]